MTRLVSAPVETLLVALPESAGSGLYGLLDVLLAAGNIWQSMAREGEPRRHFNVRIVAPAPGTFRCGNNIPVCPDVAVTEDPQGQVVILPEIWLGPDEHLHGRYPALMDWLRRRYQSGSMLYSACSGSVLLAESGLLNGCEATSHWGYQELFRTRYPQVRFRPEPNLTFADTAGRIVTAGGTTSWHDLALHIIARHVSPGEALRIAKVYLLKWHDEGQLPYTPLVKRAAHTDRVVRACETWLRAHFHEPDALSRAVSTAGIPERTLKRRFTAATGTSLIVYLQNLRVEDARRRLESDGLPVEEISAAVGYEDPSFFRRLFRRRTGLSPGEYRRLFRPVAAASRPV